MLTGFGEDSDDRRLAHDGLLAVVDESEMAERVAAERQPLTDEHGFAQPEVHHVDLLLLEQVRLHFHVHFDPELLHFVHMAEHVQAGVLEGNMHRQVFGRV